MKTFVIFRILGLAGALALLITGSYSGWPAQADNYGNPGVSVSPAVSKVSSSLSLHIKLKTQALAYPDNAPMGLPGLNPSSADPAFLNYEKVFIYLNQPPTSSQLDDLNSEGVTAYPDSWIPPVGNHPTGFILADMPIDQLDSLSNKDYVVQMDTAEQEAQPQNDLARAAMGVDSVWSGGDTGVGVTVAVLDSGIDSSNSDFPPLNSTNAKDYSYYPTLDDTIINTVSGHGTHVTGSLLGRGVNSPTHQYTGVAPGANLVFLKVGDDNTGAASSSAIIYALKAAVDTYHAKIINLSYGQLSEYHDGSDAICQAVDYATSQGASVFVASGNNADKGWHYSGTAGANSLSGDIPLTIASGTNYLEMNLVWGDGLGTHNGLTLRYYDSNHNLLASTNSIQSESSKSGVESVVSTVNSAVPSGTNYIRVQNTSNNSQFFHIFYIGYYMGPFHPETSTFIFSNPDPKYTIESPAEADTAIAVGAYVTRDNWTNYKGSPYSFNPAQTVGQIASYSSLGPRVDTGAPPKPDIVAPGTAIVSARDPLYTVGNPQYDPAIIDNDGQNLNGSGPANYFIMGGTSMAAPMAAGVGAL
ncbi:MAG TPA: S8 family serine peptidase, partial [Dehalococcoidales bacterium]